MKGNDVWTYRFKITAFVFFLFKQEEFIPIEELVTGDSSSKRKEKKADCKERIQDNRSTHFQFGSDEEPKHTEQVQKFRRDTNNLAGTILQMSIFEQRPITSLDRKNSCFVKL